jgi:hypothetical protein
VNPEAQIIAIAEACGWNYWECESLKNSQLRHPYVTASIMRGNTHFQWSKVRKPQWFNGIIDCPDFCNDLAAMHDIEGCLTMAQTDRYARLLACLDAKEPYTSHYRAAHATAAQRAEAFLRTIGKWEDSA